MSGKKFANSRSVSNWTIGPIQLLAAGYIIIALFILLLYYIPPLRVRFLSYGIRDATTIPNSTKEHAEAPTRLQHLLSIPFTPLLPLLDVFQRVRVQHAWFKHFYILSTVSSLFWLHQIISQGAAFRWLAQQQSNSRDSVVGTEKGLRAIYVWTLFFIHSARRLYESFTFDKKSKSTMWISHWIMGLLHYAAVTVALWIEAAPALLQPTSLELHVPTVGRLAVQIVPATGAFILFNQSQHWMHRYLYHLPASPRVDVPSQGLFRSAVCPHYGAEVCIYLCLFWLSCDSLGSPSWTMLAVCIFVATNLGVSALVSRERYATSFPELVVRGKSLFGLPALCGPDLTPLLLSAADEKKSN